MREEEDGEPGIFTRKELLSPGDSVLDWVGNKTERQVLAGLPVNLGVGVRIENWSRHPLTQPQVIINYGKQSGYLPVTEVGPGALEFCLLEQDQGATGVSAVVRWHIGDTDTVLSLMVSVPYRYKCTTVHKTGFDFCSPLQPPPVVLVDRRGPDQGLGAPRLLGDVLRDSGLGLVREARDGPHHGVQRRRAHPRGGE